jgi:hypothetical protein
VTSAANVYRARWLIPADGPVVAAGGREADPDARRGRVLLRAGPAKEPLAAILAGDGGATLHATFKHST